MIEQFIQLYMTHPIILFSIIGGWSILYSTGNKVMKEKEVANAKIKLNKFNESMPKSLSEIKLPKHILRRYDDINLNRFNKEKYKEMVSNFEKVLKENFPKELLSTFYNNINDASINKKSIFLLDRYAGLYHSDNNIDLVLDRAIYHELFHLASSNGISQNVGFLTDDVGRGLNEGYTQLMTERYFPGEFLSTLPLL